MYPLSSAKLKIQPVNEMFFMSFCVYILQMAGHDKTKGK